MRKRILLPLYRYLYRVAVRRGWGRVAEWSYLRIFGCHDGYWAFVADILGVPLDGLDGTVCGEVTLTVEKS